MSRIHLSSILAAACAFAATAAMAESNVHAFADVTIGNDYITPRGWVLNDHGFVVQDEVGISASLYSSKTGALSDWSVNGGLWQDYNENSQYAPGSADARFENDWWVGTGLTFSKVSVGVTIGQFRGAGGGAQKGAASGDDFTQTWIQPSLSYDDSGSGLPVTFSPYIKPFYQTSGISTVGYGTPGHNYDIEIGMSPTYTLKDSGITFIMPTWVTVGPASYWNGANGAYGVGPSDTAEKSNFGVFTTGLTVKAPLAFIPHSYGDWFWKAGVQWYHLINDNLILAEKLVNNTTGRDPVLVSTTIGLSF
jgi:hypothetical protein